MRIYHPKDPRDPAYASATIRGTWTPGRGPCPECKASTSELLAPLVVEWEPGSDVVGDFVWPGFDNVVVVSDRVRRALEEQFPCDFRPVEMRQDPGVRRPAKQTGRTKPRVWLPYRGPPLWWWLVPLGSASLDMKASNWTYEKHCSTCGKEHWRVPRENRHTIVDRSSWTGHDIFTIRGAGWVFCTEKVRIWIAGQGFLNVAFTRDGWISESVR